VDIVSAARLYLIILYRYEASFAMDYLQVLDSYHEMTKPRHFGDIFASVAAESQTTLQDWILQG